MTPVRLNLTLVEWNLTPVRSRLTTVRFNLTPVRLNLSTVRFNLTPVRFNLSAVRFNLTLVELSLTPVGKEGDKKRGAACGHAPGDPIPGRIVTIPGGRDPAAQPLAL